MYDPTEVIMWKGYIYLCRHCKTDYMRGSPFSEKLNPLRYEIGIRFHKNGPLRIRFNRDGQLTRKWSNLIYYFRKSFNRFYK